MISLPRKDLLLAVLLAGASALAMMTGGARAQTSVETAPLPPIEAAPSVDALPDADPTTGTAAADKTALPAAPATNNTTDRAAAPTNELPFEDAIGEVIGGAPGAADNAATKDPVIESPVAETPAIETPATDTPPALAAIPARDMAADAILLAIATLDQGGMPFVEKKRHAALTAFYTARDGAPVWTRDGKASPAAADALDRMARAGEDGLDPVRFAIPASAPTSADPAAIAAFEIALSHSALAFAEEASVGRIKPSSISSKYITRKPDPFDPIAALNTIAAAGDVVAALDGFNPPHEGFKRLKTMLAEVRARPPAEKPEPIAAGPTLKPGMTDIRVPAIRARLALPAVDDPLTAEAYDDALVAAMKTFQGGAGLVDDGIIGPRTLAVLNGEARDEVGEIIANMEMWRWMPRDFGTEHVFVNIPEFMVRVVRHGAVTHTARVVVGTPANQTPVFSDEMEYLVVNPYWHVPQSIKTKEMLPKIQADPAGFFRRHGYEAVWNGQVIDPSSVVWDENAVKFVAIRQPPGEVNALGNIKFMFPNEHAVYLHDTPSRKLFQRDYRAYSHGCVRVDDPMSFAGAILEDEPEWDVDKLKALFGKNERRVNLTQHVRVHLAYFNSWVDDAGVLQMRDDIYGHTTKVKKALGLDTSASQ